MKNNKLSNKKNIAIAVISIIVIILLIILAISNNKPNNNKITNSTENNETVEKKTVLDTDGTILYEFEDEKLIGISNIADTFDYLTIRKITSERTVLENQTANIKYLEFIVSDIDFLKNRDCTINSLELKEDENPFEAPRLDFTEVFGFDYKNYKNVFDVMMKIAKEAGVGTDLENSTFDQTLYDIAGQETYILNNEKLPIIQEIISQIKYDKIVKTECVYDTVYYDDGTLAGYSIHNISASVAYEINGERKIRSTTYTFGLHPEESGWK